MQYMNAVLESLAVNVPTTKFKYLSQVSQANQLKIVKQKGIYRCNYMESFKKIDKKVLHKHFQSMLKDKHAVSAKDYKHAKEVSNFK